MRILIAGGGQSAALVASRLIREGNEITILEKNKERCRELEEHLNAKIVQGSATSLRALRSAGLAQADMLIADTDSDETNVFCCMIAQTDSNVKVKLARIRTHEFQEWEQIIAKTGLRIDKIIHPETILVDRIMRVLNAPGVSDIIDFADGEIKLFGMNVDKDSWFAGKTVEELDAAGPPKDSLIAMIFRGQKVIIPHGAQRLEPGDHIYICSTKKNLNEVLKFMGIQPKKSLQKVVIVGGRQIGIWVAQELEKQNVRVNLVERDQARCELLSTILDKTVVVHGDGTDQGILVEENIAYADAFLALTTDEADNIVASLLARRLGAKKIIAQINSLNYLSIVQRLGINTPICQRLTVADMILQYVRKGRVLSVTTFREEEAEAIELIASPGSRFINKRLRDIKFPQGAIVGAISRENGEVRVPRGDVVINENDRLILFTLESGVQELESGFLTETGKQ